MIIRFYKTRETWGCFSNFSRHSIFIDGINWPTSEHYYQAQKLVNQYDIDELLSDSWPGHAAKIGRERKIRDNWENIKVEVMFVAVINKVFQNREVYDTLKKSGDNYIIEDSKRDYFWGCGHDDSGENALGKILVYIRDIFVNKFDFDKFDLSTFNKSFWEKVNETSDMEN